jgi:5'-nucleotidase
MKILLTNDDGIYADGLQALCNLFRHHHDVTVVAPDRERSAVGHGITLQSPLRCKKINFKNKIKGYAVNGLPADCIKLGVHELIKGKPDLVISGINLGANVGVNINYSGTVAAAKEAALYGIPAIAASIFNGDKLHFSEAARFIEGLADKVIEEGLALGTFLNVNLPDLPLDRILGVRLSRQGIGLFPEYFEKRLDPRKQIYYWQGCDALPAGQDSDIDSAVLYQGFISITPIKCDMTDYHGLRCLKKWGLENGFRRSVLKID